MNLLELGTIVEDFMPLFKVNEGRYVDTEHVADIEYIPAHPSGVKMPRLSEGAELVDFPAVAAHLNITLKSGEEIMFQGEQADTVWAAFQAAQTS